MKKELSPSMLSADFTCLGDQIKIIEANNIKKLHIDVMDGMFVPSISFGMPVIKSIRRCTDMVFDVHMMVEAPERYIDDIRNSGADIISFHIEACKNIISSLKHIEDIGAVPALAVSPDTPVSNLIPYLPYVGEIVVMSVNPGFGGQAFIEGSYEKICELDSIRHEMGLEFAIEVDGGVKLSNAREILKCGADILVAGSAVFENGIDANIREFKELISKF